MVVMQIIFGMHVIPLEERKLLTVHNFVTTMPGRKTLGFTFSQMTSYTLKLFYVDNKIYGTLKPKILLSSIIWVLSYIHFVRDRQLFCNMLNFLKSFQATNLNTL